VVRPHTLKVRLSDAELARVDLFKSGYGFATRAAAVRAVLRGAEPPDVTAATGGVAGPSLDSLLKGFDRPGTPEGF